MTFNSVTPTVIGDRLNLSSLYFPFALRLVSLPARERVFGLNEGGVGIAISVTTRIHGFFSGNDSATTGVLFSVGTEEDDVRFLIHDFESIIELSFELVLLANVGGILVLRGFCGSISAESGCNSV